MELGEMQLRKLTSKGAHEGIGGGIECLCFAMN